MAKHWSAENVATVLKMLSDDVSVEEVADHFGVSTRAIRGIQFRDKHQGTVARPPMSYAFKRDAKPAVFEKIYYHTDADARSAKTIATPVLMGDPPLARSALGQRLAAPKPAKPWWQA